VKPNTEHPIFNCNSIADITEANFIRRLLVNPHWRSRVFNIYGMPAVPSAFVSVDLKGAPGNFLGDVDVLLCPLSQPELATAISVKRIKFGVSAIRNGQPNKIRELKKATGQANRLADVGFHLVYSFVFVAIDTREQNADKKISFAGLPVELKQFVYNAVTIQGLNPRIGLYRTEYVQPMDDDPLSTGSFYGHLVRNAEPVQQAHGLTEWVSQATLRETAIEPVSGPSPGQEVAANDSPRT
jgi:hypothetical protein